MSKNSTYYETWLKFKILENLTNLMFAATFCELSIRKKLNLTVLQEILFSIHN